MIFLHIRKAAIRLATLLLLLLFCSVSTHADAAAKPDKTALVKKLLAVSGIEDQLAYMKDGVLGSFAQMITASYPKVPKAFWKDFNNLMGEQEMDALIDAVVPVYAKRMSTETIEKLVAMFETPFWQEWKEQMPAISREAGQIGQKWAMGFTQSKEFQKRIGALVAKHKLETLNAEDEKKK